MKATQPRPARRPRAPRAAPTADVSPAAVLPAVLAPADEPPTIRSVAIRYSENGAVPRQSFPSLWEADAALFRACIVQPPPEGGGYDKTDFLVTWTDDESHQGKLEMNAEAVAKGRAHGGMLRLHLLDVGRWLASDDHLRMFTGHVAGDEMQRRRAWGAELLSRLQTDARSHGSSGAIRNAAPYAGDGIPQLRVSKAATAWLASAPSPPTLLPRPTENCMELRDALRREFPDGQEDWADPRAHAFVNYLTHALRNDLPSIHSGDAAVIWKRWRDAVVAFRARPEGVGHGPMAYRSYVIAHSLKQAREQPGSVFQAFCPWRDLYFNRDRLDPAGVGHKVRRSPWEVDSWRS